MTTKEVANSIISEKVYEVPRIKEFMDSGFNNLLAEAATQHIMRSLFTEGLSKDDMGARIQAAILSGFRIGYVTGLLHPEERPTLTGVIKPL